MKSFIESLKYYIPPQNSGFQFVKRTIVYFPVKEVGLHVLQRKQQRISLIYETILKLITLGIRDLEKMSEMLGIEIDVYKEIIAQMAQEDIIYVTEMEMGITNKGKEALKEQKKVTIEKSQFSRIFVNQITGEIYDDEPNDLIERPQPSRMCLDGVVNANLDFFRKNFSILSDIFTKRSTNETVFSNNDEENNLYRIIDIAYEKTYFSSKCCYVYLSEDDNSYLLSFEDDKNSQYMSIALNQINNNYSGAQKLFNNDVKISVQESIIDQAKNKRLLSLIDLLEKRSKVAVSTENIEKLYYSDRYLLDGEMRELIINCNEYKPKQIIIISPFIKRLFEDNYLVDTLASLDLDKLLILYNKFEYGVKNSIEFLSKLIGRKNKDRLQCYPLYNDTGIQGTKIIVFPGYRIDIIYNKLTDNEGHEFIKRLSDITFNSEKVHNEVDDINAFLSKIETDIKPLL